MRFHGNLKNFVMDENKNIIEIQGTGESGKFTVKFNGKGNGNTMKAITVTANTETGSEVVKIKAFVKPDPNAPQKGAATPMQKMPVTQ